MRSPFNSTNLIDNRPAVVPDEDGFLIVHGSDHRQNAQTRFEDDLFATCPAAQWTLTNFSFTADVAPLPAAAASVHSNESADVQRLRS